MSIQEIFSNFKQGKQGSDYVLTLLIIGVGAGSFFLGRISVDSHNAPKMPIVQGGTVIQAREFTTAPTLGENASRTPERTGGVETTLTGGDYVASKNGTKYHLPWCAGAQRIKDENKVWFKSKADAEKAGYTPASNCKGI